MTSKFQDPSFFFFFFFFILWKIPQGAELLLLCDQLSSDQNKTSDAFLLRWAINVSPNYDWQTAISQSARADKKRLIFDLRQVRIILLSVLDEQITSLDKIFCRKPSASRFLNDATNGKPQMHFVLKQSINWINNKTDKALQGQKPSKGLRHTIDHDTELFFSFFFPLPILKIFCEKFNPVDRMLFGKCYDNGKSSLSILLATESAISRRQFWTCALETYKWHLP